MPRESTLKILRSVTAAATPSGLTAGELAVNLVDRKLFVGGTAGSNITFLDSSAVVTSFNGITGDVTGVTAGGANTFTALNSFSAGISASGATFSGLVTASGGVLTDSIFPLAGYGGAGTLYINGSTGGGGAVSTTYIGDWAGEGNGTYLVVDDTNAQINLYNPVVTSSTVTVGTGAGLVNCVSVTFGTTAANQLITSLTKTAYRSAEFFVQASTAGGAYEALKIAALHDGSNTWNTQYGVIRSGASLGTYTTTIAGGGAGSLRLRVTPTTVDTTYKVMITALPL